ncbi:TniQ protein [Chryseobacterium arachidis]|uniref:TniQ protein n=1 Tax=Chryseobacterium arachidis TaxID=1416778 RepID=A0A1M5J6F6_9FLAO|nr:TniQ family protein [Chryseobacterium arachidis]SHG35879.1 TniQ protein [Chryseobacterium arachidis]
MVYIKKYRKNIFPAYISPENNELFSSWYCRLAINHYVKPLTFIKNNFGYNAPIFGRDIDYLKPTYLTDFLYEHTPLSRKRIENLFLTSYYENFTDQSKRKSRILSLGLNHRNRKRFGTMCCPKCLASFPYYKKEWRLFTTIACCKCKSQLIDRCPKCQQPISYHKIYNSGNQSVPNVHIPFSKCWNCEIDLAKIELANPSNAELQYQKFMDITLKMGYNQFTNYSFSFVNGLILLCRSARGSQANKFNRNLNDLLTNKYNIKLSQLNNEVGFWSLEERQETLPVIYKFLTDIGNIQEELGYFKLSKSYLSTYSHDIDYWLISLLNL